MSLDDLKAQLSAGGEKVSSGKFRIDADRAIAKLRDFRLVDPHHYVLEVLRAAIASRAQSVAVKVDATRTELHFDGTPIEAGVLQNLLSHALSAGAEGDALRFRLLAFGVAGAMGLRPVLVRVASAGAALEIRGEELVFLPKFASGKGTTFLVEERLGMRAMRDALLTPVEVNVLRDGARHFPIKLTVNGKQVAETFREKDAWVEVTEEANGAVVKLALAKSQPSTTRIAIDVLGCRVVTRDLTLPLVQVTGWARDDRLRRNASGSDIVDDERGQQLMKLIRSAHAQLVAEWSARLDKLPPASRELFRKLTLAMVRDHKLEKTSRELHAAILSARLLPGPSGEFVSMGELRKEHEAGRALRYSRRKQPPGTYAPPALLMDGYHPENLFLMPTQPRVDIQREVDARRLASQERARWEREPVEDARLDARFTHRRKLTGTQLRGEVGLRSGGGGTNVRVLSRGKFLQSGPVAKLGPLRLEAVVDLTHALPESVWGALPLELSAEHLRAIETAGVAVIEAALTAAAPGELSAELREHGQDALTVLARHGDSVATVPQIFRTAPLFERAGGGSASLYELSLREELLHTPEPWPHAALSGNPVVALGPLLRESLRRLLPKARLISYEDQLRAELEVRAALARPKQLPQLRNRPHCSVPLSGDGFHGELGIPREGNAKLELILLRDGFQLENTELTPRFGPVVAVVECPALNPDDAWRHARRDAAYQKVLAAVQAGERALIPAVVASLPEGTSVMALPATAKRYLMSFIHKELVKRGTREPDAIQRAVLEAELFPTTAGFRSLNALAARPGPSKTLPYLAVAPSPKVASGVTILIADRDWAELVAEVLGTTLEDGTLELARNQRRLLFRARPERSPVVEEPFPLRVEPDRPKVRGEVAFLPSTQEGCDTTVLYQRRLLEQRLVASQLPLQATLEWIGEEFDPGGALPGDAVDALVDAVSAAETALIAKAAANPEGAPERTLLLHALRSGLESRLSPTIKDMVLQLELFPTLAGRARSAHQLGAAKRVLFTTEPVSGEPRSREPVILAAEPQVRLALERWRGKAQDCTAALKQELAARGRLSELPQTEHLRAGVRQLVSVRIDEQGFEGEVGLGEAGVLFLFHERRLLSRVSPGGWPAFVAAGVEAPGIEPTQDYSDAVRNGAYTRMTERVARTAESLGEPVAASFASLGAADQEHWAPKVAGFTLWALARKAAPDSLLALKVFRRTDGGALSAAELLREHRERKRVLFANVAGALLDPDEWVWRPREGELELISSRLDLQEGASELKRAAEVKARPRLPNLKVPSSSKWRERIEGPGLEGEVVLEPQGESGLRVDWVRGRVLVESALIEHALPALARVQSEHLQTNASWTKVNRNAAFRAAREAIEAALELLVHRFLSADHDERAWRDVAVAALGWRLGRAGALGTLLPQLPLLTTLGGGKMTVGEALAERARTGSIAVAEPQFAATDARPVVSDTAANRRVLEALSCPTEDVSADLRRKRDLERTLRDRRLASLKYGGEALVTLDVDEEGFRGQLALPMKPTDTGEIVLARAGISVGTYPEKDRGVEGVISHDTLPVEGDWGKPVMTPILRKLLAAKLSALFERLADKAHTLRDSQLELAAHYALRFISNTGANSPAALDRLSGAAAALASAPLFRLPDGTRVDLRTVADPVQRGRRVGIVSDDFVRRGSGGELALVASRTNAPWVRLLGSVLGGGAVVELQDSASWDEWTREADPEEHTPLGRGLIALRKHARLLRSDAFGRLGMDELSEIRLRPAKGKRPIRYDFARKIVLLDPDHLELRRALEQSDQRPDRLFLIVASIYGAVNRALPEVTDEDEARLTSALLKHLANNPRLLEPG